MEKILKKIKEKIMPGETPAEDGTYTENGIRYNKYGLCLDCVQGSLECTHQNLIEDKGKTVCATCGIAI